MLFLKIDKLMKLVRRIKDPEHAMECAGAIEYCKKELRKAEEAWEKAMLKYIKKHGPIEVKMGRDTVKYYAGHKKETKCTDTKLAVQLLRKKAGALGLRLALNSQPFKNAHVKKVLGPKKWGRCFKTTEKRKLNAEGNVQAILKKADSRYT